MRKTWLTGVLLVLLLITASVVGAQTGQRIPAIVQFSAGTPSFTVSELEAGTARAVLAWHIINIANQRITLESYSLNGWESMLVEGETLAPVGTREITVRHPLTFGTPTYRLAVVDDDEGRVVSEQYLTIPYTESAEPPTIEQFTTDTTALNSAELIQRSARAVVRWSVAGRIPTSNLIFEQVISPEDVISVELPREFLWVPSQGQGEVAPDVPLAIENGVLLRLTVIDVVTGTVYDQAEITVPVTGAEIALPTAEFTETPTPTESAVTTLVAPATPVLPAEGAPRIVVFTTDVRVASAGQDVIVSWNVENASAVQIQEQYPDGSAGLLYLELPPSGALRLTMEEGFSGITYILRARSADGQEVSQEVLVGGAR